MNMLPLPQTPEELTVDVLNNQLANSSSWSGGAIQGVTIETYGGEDSMSAAVYKLNLELSSGDQATLIAKLRDVGGSPQAQQGSHHEILFYRDLADVAGVASPHAYVAEYDISTHRMLLIQEFLSDGAIGTNQTFLSFDDSCRIVSALAGMHAEWWNSVQLARLTQIRTFEAAMGTGFRRFESDQFSGLRFLEKYGDHVHPDIARVYGSIKQWAPVLQYDFSNNRTLCHYDVTAKNLSLPENPEHPPIFFDWSLVTRGSIGIELAVILAYSMQINEHAQIPEILKFYLHAMHQLGVSDLSYETLWNDFRYGLLVRLAAPIALTSRGYPPADALALQILPRITSAVLKTEALELLN